MRYLILRLWEETRVIDKFNKMGRITDLHHSLQLSYTFGTLQPYNNNKTQIENRNHMQIIRSFTCLLGKTIIQITWYFFYSSRKNMSPNAEHYGWFFDRHGTPVNRSTSKCARYQSRDIKCVVECRCLAAHVNGKGQTRETNKGNGFAETAVTLTYGQDGQGISAMKHQAAQNRDKFIIRGSQSVYNGEDHSNVR